MKRLLLLSVFLMLLGCDQSLTAVIEDIDVEENQLVVRVRLSDPDDLVDTFSINLLDENDTIMDEAGTNEGLTFSGTYDVYFSLSNVASGNYLVVIIVNDEVVTSQSVNVE